MKILSRQTVFQAAIKRIEYLFDEFEEVVVNFSGGKDSTVVLNLALAVAKKRGRLPLRVMWIDQEAEWQGTVDYCTAVMTAPEVMPMWYQMPMVITNNASSFNRFSYCWAEEDRDKWIHPKHELSVKENKYGTDRFHDLFEAIFRVEMKGKKACYIAGVRAEEAPKRLVALTASECYKGITWGKKYKEKDHYTFYPIYDWSYTDVWKFIHDTGALYNKVYDGMYCHGVSVMDMRVSNLHHETAIQSLMLVQEIEPHTWNKVAARIDGANTIKHIKKNSFTCPKELPPMFVSWEEYANHLIDNIVQEEKNRVEIKKKIESKKKTYDGINIRREFWMTIINTVLSSDWDYTKLVNFEMRPHVYSYRKFKRGRIDDKILNDTKAFTKDEIDYIRMVLNARKPKKQTGR